MADIFKRGNFWAYDFRFRNKRYQGSTRLKNKELAKAWVAKLRSDLALGLVGLTAREPAPILSEFLEGKFLDSVRQNAKKDKTRLFYEQRVKRLCSYIPFQTLRLDQIDELTQQGYKDFRLAKKLSPATINGELRTLRKALIFADDCGLIKYRRVRALPGEKNRTFVLTGDMEKAYLAAADYPLRQVATLMLDLGLRTGEAIALKKTDVTDEAVTVREGKSANARRSIPQTSRTRDVLELCFALFPDSPWVFPGRKGEHYTRGAIDNLHTKLRDAEGFPREFVLYNCRHSFGTRLAESGASVWDIMGLMGHSDIKISQRYIHPSAGHLSLAMKRKEELDKIMRGEVHSDSPDKEKSTR